MTRIQFKSRTAFRSGVVAKLAALAAAGFLSNAPQAEAQEMEPRAFSVSPVGTNFLIGGYARTTGSVSTDPSLPISNVQATITSGVLGYQRSMALAGRAASAALVVPYVNGDVSGDLEDQSRQVSRTGLGDVRIRLATNLLGGPALTPAEFAQRAPTTTLGASLTIVAPTGQYNPSNLINISSHRWAFKPEIGLSQPIGKWFADASAGVWLFTDNTNFFRGNVRSQDPIWTFELHGGYNFRPGLWLAVDGTYYTGGETSVNGTGKRDLQGNSRYGLTFSVPVLEGVSVKLAWSKSLITRVGGNFQTVGLTLQYRWFDP
ncbi:transporter [Azospirillum sp. sgz301742]